MAPPPSIRSFPGIRFESHSAFWLQQITGIFVDLRIKYKRRLRIGGSSRAILILLKPPYITTKKWEKKNKENYDGNNNKPTSAFLFVDVSINDAL
jgi:hypothetical protein